MVLFAVSTLNLRSHKRKNSLCRIVGGGLQWTEGVRGICEWVASVGQWSVGRKVTRRRPRERER